MEKNSLNYRRKNIKTADIISIMNSNNIKSKLMLNNTAGLSTISEFTINNISNLEVKL